jgi:hypothetical protein
MVEPEQTSIAKKRIGNRVPVTTHSNVGVVARMQVANRRCFIAMYNTE